MATYYAYAASNGNWTWTSANTTNWYSATGGGGTNGTAPTASDTCIFDGNSGTGTVTWSTGVCLTLQCNSGYTGTLGNGSTAHTIPGSFNLVSGMTYNDTGTLTFSSTSSGNTITTGGSSMPSLTFNGVGGVWTLQDTTTLASGKSILLTNGDLECNGQTITAATLQYSANTNSKTLTISNCSITLNGTSTVFGANTDSADTTINANTSTNIYITDTSATSKTIYTGNANSNQIGNVNITGSTNLGIVAIDNAGGIYNLTNTPGNPVNIQFMIALTVPITSFNITGSATTQSSISTNTPGTKTTLTLTNNSTWTYVTVQDIHVTGATITNTTGGYSGGNTTGITFPNPYLLQTVSSDSASSAATITAIFGSNVTAKSLLVAVITLASGTVSSVADAESNTNWTQTGTTNQAGAITYVYHCWNATGGTTNKLTVTLSTTGLAVSVIYREYGGIVYASNPVDQVTTNTGTSGNITVTTGSNTLYAKEIVITSASDFTGTDAMTVGSLSTNFITQATVTTAQSAMEEYIVSTTGTFTTGMGNSVTSTWNVIQATFQTLQTSTNHFLTLLGAGS